jgi:hypothetical protein
MQEAKAAEWTAYTAQHCKSGVKSQWIFARETRLVVYCSNQLGTVHTMRAQRIIHEVWKRNPEGRAVEDWPEMLRQLGWEIFFV